MKKVFTDFGNFIKNIKSLWFFVAGVIVAMIFNYFYNMNGRYVPFEAVTKGSTISILDTRTCVLYLWDIGNDGKLTLSAEIDLTEDFKKNKK